MGNGLLAVRLEVATGHVPRENPDLGSGVGLRDIRRRPLDTMVKAIHHSHDVDRYGAGCARARNNCFVRVGNRLGLIVYATRKKEFSRKTVLRKYPENTHEYRIANDYWALLFATALIASSWFLGTPTKDWVNAALYISFAGYFVVKCFLQFRRKHNSCQCSNEIPQAANRVVGGVGRGGGVAVRVVGAELSGRSI